MSNETAARKLKYSGGASVESLSNLEISIERQDDNASESTPLIANGTPSRADDDSKVHFAFSSKSRRMKRVQSFYKRQNHLLESFESDKTSLREAADADKQQLINDSDDRRRQRDIWLAQGTFVTNIILLVAKAVSAYLSGSLSVISSVIESAVDVTSGVVIWATNKAIQNNDPYMYPRGKSKLEPLSVIIVAIIMAVASLQMIIQSVQSIVNQSVDPDVGIDTIAIMASVIVVKLILFIICYRQNTPSSLVLATDHRNDCISNFFAIVCAALGDRYWVYIDPIGAIIVALYIIVVWCFTGAQQIPLLSGKRATPEIINRIIKLCVDHDKRIKQLETVHVYHYGSKFLVEVHIIMDEKMCLRVSHDISEQLQIKLEHLPYVERAFVHCDYYSDTGTKCICGQVH